MAKLLNNAEFAIALKNLCARTGKPVAEVDRQAFAKAVHDLCVRAGAECPQAARCADHANRRNLTVREAESMGARRPLTLAEAARMRSR